MIVWAPESAIRLQYSRSGGPGGQNVNKVNTRVGQIVAAKPSVLGAEGVTKEQIVQFEETLKTAEAEQALILSEVESRVSELAKAKEEDEDEDASADGQDRDWVQWWAKGWLRAFRRMFEVGEDGTLKSNPSANGNGEVKMFDLVVKEEDALVVKEEDAPEKMEE